MRVAVSEISTCAGYQAYPTMQRSLSQENICMMLEFPINIPIAPCRGEDIVIDGASAPQKVGDEFARLKLGENRFAVRTEAGDAFEVTCIEVTERPRRHRWRAGRSVSREEFSLLPTSPTR
jgi:hypothetical protein